MTPIPLPLLHDTPAEERSAISHWWDALSEAEQHDLTRLCDEQTDGSFFTSDDGGETPLAIGGRFVPHDDASRIDEWGPSYFEHLLQHPELMCLSPTEPVVIRTYRICTRHPEAQAVLGSGFLPADFRCPFASADCPMRRILDVAPGRSVRLFPVV